MHQALKDVLGDQVKQAGSEVSHLQTRFDFSYNRAMSADAGKVEELVNEQIMQNHPVQTQVLPIEQARESGAVAMFGEKYGEVVRVIGMGDYSKEFCGGTHVPATGVIGSFKVIGEEAIASGVRRITAVAGQAATATAAKTKSCSKAWPAISRCLLLRSLAVWANCKKICATKKKSSNSSSPNSLCIRSKNWPASLSPVNQPKAQHKDPPRYW